MAASFDPTEACTDAKHQNSRVPDARLRRKFDGVRVETFEILTAPRVGELVEHADVVVGIAHRQYIEEVIPHIGSLLSTDLDEVVRSGEIVIIGTKSVAKAELAKLLSPGQVVVDLVNLDRSQRPDSPAAYQGICW